MKTVKKTRNIKPTKYEITSIYKSEGKDIKVILERVFKNYCANELKKY